MSVQFIPADGWKKLEFDKLIEHIQPYCLSAHTKEQLSKMPILTQVSEIKTIFEELAEWNLSIEEREAVQLSAIVPIMEDVYLLQKEGYVLSVESIININEVIQNHRRISAHFTEAKQTKYPVLFNLFQQVNMEKQVYPLVDKVFDEEGEVKPNASPDLAIISKQIKSKQRAIDSEFNKLLTKYRNQGMLSDTSESYRNGRRVLTVPAENKRKIKGIIHDESQTGKTVFIEPDAIIPFNNDLFDLYADRKREIYRIIKQLCNDLRPYGNDFLDSFNLQIHYDVIQSKAAFSKLINGVIPNISDQPVLSFKKAYHPLLLIKNSREDKETVPFELVLHGQNRVLMISGPNAGGKSILMKAVGLIQLMFQAGIPIPVDSDTTMGIFKKICIDIGDQQSIEDDLSTYSSRLKNMKEFTETLDRDSLVLIDEFGSGTDPKIGGAIAEALLKNFILTGCSGVITSHYSNLKLFAYKTKGIVNGAMIFDQKELQATYEMKIGRPGSSFAFEIASKIGLDPKILKYAKSKTGKDNVEVETLLTDLQKEKQELESKVGYLEKKSQDLEKLIKNYEVLHGELEYKRKKLKMEQKAQKLGEKNENNKRVERLIREIKEEKNIEKAKKLSRTLKEEKKGLSTDIDKLKKDVYYAKDIDISQFKKGSFVKLKTGSEIGKILGIKKNKAEVSIGIMRMFVPLTELIPAREPIETNRRKSVTSQFTSNHQDVDDKLDIRGFSMGEAAKILEGFLDKFLLSSNYEVKIIHGVGTGALKKVVWAKAKDYKDFSNIFHPEEEAGGEGVTIIQS
ncbi:endonuclease MutS2 [Portibacter lacus]|uniref:Endonuclease MutS2 n=1 Tax=Portibacter lacus TaxID=1099794 RepID=A0AA37SQ12_9BACT|nr:Smr/MutS family protein [Portibacter lacus]GLR17452.1 endonuclease MutS2 [Portibacter lacus]